MSKFIDRHEELNALEDEYKRNTASFFILYGRRRVGKTSLIREFIKDKEAIYFLATEEDESQNRESFKNIVATYANNKLLQSSHVNDWHLIFDALLEHKSNRKKIIVIDEFQYIGKSNKAFPSVIQRIWDNFLANKNVMLILCGSFISMMESQTLSYDSPLYGRRTGQIKLKQIPFRFYNEFYPHMNDKELIEYYAVTGGTPKYIELFYNYENIYKAIEHNILSPSTFLYDEPNFLLQNEVSQIGSYFSIIKSIAAGNHSNSKIASNLGVKETSLSKYLNVLINLDILKREVPVTETNPSKSKRGLYKINDNFLQFWFKFVYPNQSYIESGNEKYVINKINTNFIDNHVSYIYEDICLEKMWDLNRSQNWSFHFDKVGRWWDKNTEIDVIALDNEGKNIIFGECKYWKEPVGLNVLIKLKEKAQKVSWNETIRADYFILFSISGFTEELTSYAESESNILLQS